MKVTKEQSTLNKEKILVAASKLYREHGIDGIGIGELSKSVGLTHGGFYRQFPEGKEQLVSEAIARTFDEYCAHWSTKRSAKSIVKGYLSSEHLQNKQDGCPMPTLAADVARAGGAVSETYTDGLRRMLTVISEKKDGDSDHTSEEKAMQMMASMAGALMIARASSDQALAKKFMSSVIKLWNDDTTTA
ncbi:TetR/AcrR family transcriptional regulator [Pseudomonas sp. NPDC090203]|uniref:TetR/AcrR family transcriptional regulator n=1 Tax=Pseudomonas sp. NPDC090203 TaxID=3364477 RepID=UPI003808660C